MGKRLDGLSKRISAAMDSALEKVAIEVGYEIEKIYESVITEFYDSYEPHRYDRTKSTFYGSDIYGNYHDPVRIDDGFLAGISVSPDTIPGNPYRADKNWVFERTFVKGYHGYNGKEIKKWRQLPHIRELIKAGKYHYYRPPEMRVMKTKPEKLMEKRVRKLAKDLPKKYNQMFVDELTKAISKG